MALNISLPSTAITELESYRWYGPTGASLKDVRTSISFDESTWTDVSDQVMQIAISGAVVNQSGEPGANTAAIELDNHDKRFSDLWTSSPYSGNLLPGKSTKIEMSVACSLVTIFAGKIDAGGFAEARSGHEGTVQVRVADGADRLEKKKFDKDYYYAGKKLVGTDETDSLLHILLMTHGGLSAGNVITNGEVSVIVPYTSFKEGESVQYRVRELARGCQPGYCGFRHDGNFVMESRLVTGWSVPSSEYTLTASSFDVDVQKTLLPLLGNHVKVRGDKVDFIDSAIVLWELRTVKPKGKNRVFPGWCWETVASGDFFLSDPAAVPPEEYWAQYEVPFGEIIHVESTAISQTIYEGAAFDLHTTGTDLEAEETKGKLVLQNSQPQSVTVMNIQITGKAAIRRSIGKRSEADIAHLKLDHGVSDDDLQWGLVASDSNPSSIAAYGQTDLVISSEYIVQTSQMIAILDWNLKYGKDPKHHFSLGNLPFLAFVQPGAMLNLGLSDLGYGALVEVAEFSHSITPMGANTVLGLVETPADWTVSCAVSVEQIVAAPSGGTGEGEVGAAGLGGNLIYTVGSAGSWLPCDAICDGTDDQSEINSAIVFQAGNGGGVVCLVGSTFNTTAAVVLDDHITLEIAPGATIKKNGNFNAVECIGTSGTHKHNVEITGGGTISRDAADGNVTKICYFEYVDDLAISNINIVDAFGFGIWVGYCSGYCRSVTLDGMTGDGNNSQYGIVISNSEYFRCENNVVKNIIDNVDAAVETAIKNLYGDGVIISNNVIENIGGMAHGVGIHQAAGTGIAVGSNRIVGCTYRGMQIDVAAAFSAIQINNCRDNGNLIDHGDCESVVPHITADAYSLLNCTISLLSAISAYAGTSYAVFTKTNYASAASAAYYWLVDNNTITDMHTLSKIQGAYKLAARMRCPTGGVDPTEAQLIVSQYSGGAWVDTTMSCPSTLSVWAAVETTMTMLSTCVATRLGFKAAATAEINETLHFDNVQFIPQGVTNEHQQNFYDAGTDTATGGNSWQ